MKPNGRGKPESETPARTQLERAADVLGSAGYYAYLHLDEQNRWSVSIDTDDGHADVRLGGGVYVIDVWDTSPGLFWDEDDERRFYARERRARILVPTIARSVAEPGQEVWWDDQDHGVGARVQEFLDFDESSALPRQILQQFDELNRLLAEIERRLLD